MINVGGIQFAIKIDARGATNSLNNLNAQLGNLQTSFKTSGQNANKSTKSWEAAASAAASFAAALGGVKLINKAKESALLAARVESLGTVLQNVGRQAGTSAAQIGLIEDRVKALGITTRQTRQALAQMAQANLDLGDAAKLARIAQDAAVIAGINSSDAFERLIVSVQRNDVRLLRNLGIVINLNNVYREFSQTTGRTANSLSSFEKRQLLLNKVVERGRLIQGNYEASLQDVFKRMNSLKRVNEEATKNFGEQFIPVLELAVDEYGKFIKLLGKSGSAFNNAAGGLSVLAGAITATGTSLSVLGAAYRGFLLLGGPLPKLITAVSIAAGFAATAFFRSARAAHQFGESIKLARSEAEKTSLAFAKRRSVLGAVKDIGESSLETKAKLELLRLEFFNIVQAFPDVKDFKIQELLDEENFGGLIDLLSSKIPDAYANTEIVLKKAEKDVVVLTKVFKRFIGESVLSENTGMFTVLSGNEMDETRSNLHNLLNLMELGQIGVKEFGAAIEGLPISEHFKLMFVEVAKQLAAARGTMDQEIANSADDTIARLSNKLKGLDQVGQTIAESLKQSTAAQFKVLKDSGLKQLDQTLQQLRTLDDAAKASPAEVTQIRDSKTAAAEAAEEKQKKNIQNRLRAEIEALGTSSDAAAARATKQQELDDVAEESNARLKVTIKDINEEYKTRIDLLAGVGEARTAAISSLNQLLDRQQARADALRDEAVIYHNELDPAIATVDRRLKTLKSNYDIFNKGITPVLNEAIDNVKRLKAAVDSATEASRATPHSDALRNHAATTQALLDQEELRLQLIGRLRRTFRSKTFAEGSALDKKRAHQLTKELEKRQESMANAQSEILRLSGLGDFDTTNLQRAEASFTKLETSVESLDEFFRRFETNQNRKGASKVIFGIREEVRKFDKLLKGAVTQEDIDKLKEIFPKVIKQRIEGAREALRKFREDAKSGSDADFDADKAKFEELIGFGASIQDATNAVQGNRAQRNKAKREEEKQLEQDVRDSQKEGRGAQKEFDESLEKEVALLPKKQEMLVEVNRLRDEETLKLQEQLDILGEQFKVIEDMGGELAKINGTLTLSPEQQALRDEQTERFEGGTRYNSFGGLVTAGGGEFDVAAAEESLGGKRVETSRNADKRRRATRTPTVAERKAQQTHAANLLKARIVNEGGERSLLAEASQSVMKDVTSGELAIPNIIDGINTMAGFMIAMDEALTKAAGSVKKRVK